MSGGFKRGKDFLKPGGDFGKGRATVRVNQSSKAAQIRVAMFEKKEFNSEEELRVCGLGGADASVRVQIMEMRGTRKPGFREGHQQEFQSDR